MKTRKIESKFYDFKYIRLHLSIAVIFALITRNMYTFITIMLVLQVPQYISFAYKRWKGK